MDAKTRALWIAKRAIMVVLNSKAEAIMLLFALAYYLPSAFIQNLIIQKLCLRRNYTRDYCLSDTINKTLEESMQEEASQLFLYFYLLKQLPAIILALFMGQWCDKYGRKYVMIISFLGCTVSAILYLVNAIFVDWPPVYVILSAIPAGLSGEYAGFMMGLYGFVKDLHPVKSLSVRMSTCDGTESLAIQIGPLFGGLMYVHFAYEGVFLMCVAMLISGLALSAVFVKDEQFRKEVDSSVVFKDFFDWRGFVSSLSVVFRRREGHFRAYILCVMVCVFITTMSNNGVNEILFLYTRLTVEWDVTTFNYYNGLTGGTGAIGSLLLLPVLVKVFHLSDCVVGSIGLLSNVVFYYILAFARDSRTYYASVCLLSLNVLCYFTFRSIVTKCISFTEMGKAMAVYAVVQAGSTNLGRVLATQIYAHTYRSLPGTYLLFTASLSLISVAIYLWILFDLRRSHVVLGEENKETLN